MTLDAVINTAVNALITGGSSSFGMWLVAKHVIGRFDNTPKPPAVVTKDDKKEQK